MKTILTFLFIFNLLFPFQTMAQHELWGMTAEGGGVHGVIFKTDSSGNNYSVEYMFSTLERNPKGFLMLASNGLFYGMSSNGGLFNLGTIFEYNYETATVTVLHNFDGASTGAHPQGGLMQADNGLLYGMTYDGGNVGVGRGVLFSYDITTSTFTKLHDFNDTGTGAYPYGNVIQADDGKLYGMNYAGGGGSTASGILFVYDIDTGVLTKLGTFGVNLGGENPMGSLLQASDGLLYGVTRYGGTYSQGIIFSYNTTTSTFTNLQSFNGNTIGAHPMGSVIEGKNGNLYGIYNDGSGSAYVGGVFEYDIDDDTLVKKIDFLLGSATGGWPERNDLIEGDSNMFFGMTNRGGAHDDGVIFKYDNNSGTYTNLYDFDLDRAASAYNVYGSLLEVPSAASSIMSSTGKYLSLTNAGGIANKGFIFEYDTLTQSVAVKYTMDSMSTGQKPQASLIAASNGKLYGLTVSGGAYNAGVLFEYDQYTGNYEVKHVFDGAATGANPYCTLIEATNGKLYGVTEWGGTDNGQGTFFEFDPGSGILTKKHDFGYAPAPGRPIGGLVQASDGHLYGMSSYGGVNNKGAFYQYNISTETFTKIKDIAINDEGIQPEGALIETGPDTLFGLARSGGANSQGTLFEYIISTTTMTAKHDFDNNTTGREPKGDLILVNGKLYGMTSNGGSNGAGYGTIFEYVLSSGDLNVLHTFVTPVVNGRFPFGSLVYLNNKLYGMTSSGGTAGYSDRGILFEYNLTSGIYTKKVDLNDTLGQKPVYNSMIAIFIHAEWTGAVSTDWHNPANWAENDVPSVFTEVVIPDVSGTSGNFPYITGDVHVRDLTIEPGATINMQDGVNVIIGREGDNY